MAGDWIKMNSNLWDHPKVSAICDLTEENEATIIGALYRFWSIGDQHSEDGRLPSMTLTALDRKTGVRSFADSLRTVGWLGEDENGLYIPSWEDHHSSSAKRRAKEAQRKANSRKNPPKNGESQPTENQEPLQSVRNLSASVRTETGHGAELEKRREEKNRDIEEKIEKTESTTTSQQKAYDTRTSESTNPEVVVESKISKVVFLEIAKRLEIPGSFAEAIWLEQSAIGWTDADGKNIVSPGIFLQSAWRREQARSKQSQESGLREPWKIEADIKRVKAEIQNLQNNPLSRNNTHGFTDSKEEHRNRYESDWLETVAKCYDEAKEKLPEQVAQLGVLLESEREALSGNASAIAEFEKPEYRLIRFADEFDGAPDFETWDKDFNKPNHWRDPKGLTPEAITEMKLLRQSVNRLEGELREGLR